MARADGSPQTQALGEALITRDRKQVYRVDDGIPVLLCRKKPSPPPRSPTSRRMSEPANPGQFAPPDPVCIQADVARALAEDIGHGDVTAALLADTTDSAYLLCKQVAVIAGRPWFDATHRTLDPAVEIDWRVREGQHVPAGTVLATLRGSQRSLVSAGAQRAQLPANTVGHRYRHRALRASRERHPHAHPGHRKTLPGLRLAQRNTRCAAAAASTTASACSMR